MHKVFNGAFKEALRHIVGVQFRNTATVGGSVFPRYGFSDVLTVFASVDTYVELYKGFYAGIKNKKLNIYDYEGNKITKEDLDIPETGYSRVSNPAFKITKENGNYVIEVLKGMSYYKSTYYTDRDTYKEKVEEEVPEEPSTPEEENNEEESGS